MYKNGDKNSAVRFTYEGEECFERQIWADPTRPRDNGFIVAWQDYRNGRDNPDLYAQRIGDVPVTRYFLPLIQKTAK